MRKIEYNGSVNIKITEIEQENLLGIIRFTYWHGYFFVMPSSFTVAIWRIKYKAVC